MRRVITLFAIIALLVTACAQANVQTSSPSITPASPSPSTTASASLAAPSANPAATPTYCDQAFGFSNTELSKFVYAQVEVQIYQKVAHSSTRIFIGGGRGIARKGFIITAAHVVEQVQTHYLPDPSLLIIYIDSLDLKTKTVNLDATDANIIYYNQQDDIAILKPHTPLPGMKEASLLQWQDATTLSQNAQLCMVSANSGTSPNLVEGSYVASTKNQNSARFDFSCNEEIVRGSSGGAISLFAKDHVVIVGMFVTIIRDANTYKTVGGQAVNIASIVALVKKDTGIDLS